ncbi:hypothetical protein B842_07950 [Corynebacterium humireducens NBRC 106098 = DSM 45392]|uniref:Uncharacterized protein n=1 Tax=Corynebacterium humireducens NBRC 106098 = DSM 45392 TaxID=1223515 RepID=A0A0B5DCE2_9CORY|nr:hypothetical protein [Corynebacterium humireducens]AJE33439.1 hypothetical protein B842_07950 [Corynebacterium humireducens NBRC 106098 = DSM 45392]
MTTSLTADPALRRAAVAAASPLRGRRLWGGLAGLTGGGLGGVLATGNVGDAAGPAAVLLVMLTFAVAVATARYLSTRRRVAQHYEPGSELVMSELPHGGVSVRTAAGAYSFANDAPRQHRGPDFVWLGGRRDGLLLPTQLVPAA